MLDPWRSAAPASIRTFAVGLADRWSLPALPFHAHEVLFALAFYTFIGNVASPLLSPRLFPGIYPKMNTSAKRNWDVHIVSMLQSIIINALSLYVMFYDSERKAWSSDGDWPLRIWGYSGMCGLLQSLALGYFGYDLYMCVRHVGIFGTGMVAHALASASMFTLGFRPFVHYYCPVFLLHELSTPFLNIHWFCDKFGLTGSTFQAINGALLIAVFFGCRLVWGTFGAIWVSSDVYRATFSDLPLAGHAEKIPDLAMRLADPIEQTKAFLKPQRLPLWLGAAYIAANASLALLNAYWFTQMIAAVRKRFGPPIGTKRSQDDRNGRAKKE